MPQSSLENRVVDATADWPIDYDDGDLTLRETRVEHRRRSPAGWFVITKSRSFGPFLSQRAAQAWLGRAL